MHQYIIIYSISENIRLQKKYYLLTTTSAMSISQIPFKYRKLLLSNPHMIKHALFQVFPAKIQKVKFLTYYSNFSHLYGNNPICGSCLPPKQEYQINGYESIKKYILGKFNERKCLNIVH